MPRGKPFQPGCAPGPGRPKGSENKRAKFEDLIDKGQVLELVQVVMKMALAGDTVCQRMALDRLFPVQDARTELLLARIEALEALIESMTMKEAA